MDKIVRTPQEIREQIEQAFGDKYGGMTYENGVEAALMWVLGDRDDKPMED